MITIKDMVKMVDGFQTLVPSHKHLQKLGLQINKCDVHMFLFQSYMHTKHPTIVSYLVWFRLFKGLYIYNFNEGIQLFPCNYRCFTPKRM